MYEYICRNCNNPLSRVHKDGEIFCNSCEEPILKDVDSWSLDRYIKCPNKLCGYEGEETINPSHGDKCPDCGALLL